MDFTITAIAGGITAIIQAIGTLIVVRIQKA
jgi:hypothetical protein